MLHLSVHVSIINKLRFYVQSHWTVMCTSWSQNDIIDPVRKALMTVCHMINQNSS